MGISYLPHRSKTYAIISEKLSFNVLLFLYSPDHLDRQELTAFVQCIDFQILYHSVDSLPIPHWWGRLHIHATGRMAL